ncbi:hypothetical protein [Burkholderia stabilis]|nr:hypothetical protein [Burkholderia stabilis]
MNLQTTKPRARIVSTFGKPAWRVTFPGLHTGFVGVTLDSALGVAYRCRLARITGRRDA